MELGHCSAQVNIVVWCGDLLIVLCGFVYQSTIDDVEALRKRHEDFAKALHGQDEKLKALDELADRLIREGHPDSALYVKLLLISLSLFR